MVAGKGSGSNPGSVSFALKWGQNSASLTDDVPAAWQNCALTMSCYPACLHYQC